MPESADVNAGLFMQPCWLQLVALEGFTRLERLIMDGCIGMSNVALNLPFLRHLSSDNCTALTQVRLGRFVAASLKLSQGTCGISLHRSLLVLLLSIAEGRMCV